MLSGRSATRVRSLLREINEKRYTYICRTLPAICWASENMSISPLVMIQARLPSRERSRRRSSVTWRPSTSGPSSSRSLTPPARPSAPPSRRTRPPRYAGNKTSLLSYFLVVGMNIISPSLHSTVADCIKLGQSYLLVISYPLDKITNVYTIRHWCFLLYLHIISVVQSIS